MTARKQKTPASAPDDAQAAGPRSGDVQPPAAPQDNGIYGRYFSPDENRRIVAAVTEVDPAGGIDTITAVTYVLLDRIIARISAETAGREILQPDAFLKLVTAHNATTGRLASLLRMRRMICNDEAEALSGSIAAALDQLAEAMHVEQ